jgi:DNA mismatch repair protein MutL
VKELVENALDAQAARVILEIQAGGRSLIRVTDDGTGMSRDDALLCLERHATSKIQKAEDLAAIVTMGFRGEALPSIASVSRFTLTTRERFGVPSRDRRDDSNPPGRVNAELQTEPVEGTQIIVNGGKIVEVKAAGSATGTSVEVRQLFFNLPARRKFMRTEETEAAHIQHYLTLAALAYPEVAFTFQKDGRLVWQLPAHPAKGDGAAISSRLDALRERLRSLLGEEKLLSVNFTAALDESVKPEEIDIFETASTSPSTLDPQPSTLCVWGFIGSPGVSRATRECQHLFVNRRPVENRGLNYALLEGYHTALMKGRYPVCCLFLEIDPAAVDVNIHPAKREVKFHREFEIRKFVARAVQETLLAFHGQESKAQPVAPKQGEGGSPKPKVEAVKQTELQPVPILPNFPEKLKPSPATPPHISPAAQTPLKMGFLPRRSEAEAGSPPSPAKVEPATNVAEAQSAISNRQSAIEKPSALDPRPSTSVMPLLSVPLRLVGVIGKLYAVLESDRGLVLLDQHAAHERILFEQMLNRLEQNGIAPSQKLLLPETVELPARDANFLREQLAVLTRLGVGLSEFGERTFLLDALPPFVKTADARRFVLDLVDELKAAGREVNLARLGEHTIAKTVCRHAVKANDPLAGAELENLVEDLRRCAMPYTCPHGRPTLIEMNYRELEKKFGRTQ